MAVPPISGAPATETGVVTPPLVAFQQPEPPAMEAMMAYYRLSEEAGFYSNGGPCARLLSDRLATYLGNDTLAIPVSNCTVGLMVAMRAAFGAPREERRLVVTPSYTFTATACAIEWAGFEPLFVDVDPVGWHVDPA